MNEAEMHESIDKIAVAFGHMRESIERLFALINSMDETEIKRLFRDSSTGLTTP